ncbi:reverse transcriptase domain-containing protein [Tanacetum coccineum]
MKSKYSRDDYLYCADHTAKLIQEQAEPVEPLEWKAPETRLNPLSIEPPKLELKELPEHLEYAFLQEDNQLLVVISSALSAIKKARLLEVPRNHKGVIVWSIANRKGIDSSLYTYKILMEDEFKPSIQSQRRVNPNIKEVVKKEVIKLLDAGLIYPISDSPWVSPVQVVLKKEGTTVVKKDKNKNASPIMIKPDWSLPFEIMYDASDYAVGAVLEQRKDKHFQPIHYASKTMNKAQENYTTIEKELLAVVFASTSSDNTWSYPKLLPYEFDIEIRDKKGAKNLVADHLSRLENPDVGKLTKAEIRDLFPEEQLMTMSDRSNEPLYVDYANYLASHILPFCSTRQEKQKFFNDLRHYFWDKSFLFKQCADQIIRRCVAGNEAAQILQQCHSSPSGGHHGIATTARKVFEARFYEPNIFRDVQKLVWACDTCQRARNISSRDETPQKYIQVCEIFDLWVTDFMGSFPSSNGNKYILVAINYVSKWVEAQAFPASDA